MRIMGAFCSFAILSLTCLTAESIGKLTPLASMNEMKASRSFGRHIPSNGRPPYIPHSLKSSRRPTASRGMSRLTSSDLTPTVLHARSISLKKLIFAALKRFEVYLTISDVSTLHRVIGDPNEEYRDSS